MKFKAKKSEVKTNEMLKACQDYCILTGPALKVFFLFINLLH